MESLAALRLFDPIPLRAAVRNGGHPAMQTLQRYAELIGIPLMCCDSRNARVIALSDGQQLPVVPVDLLRQAGHSKSPRVISFASGLVYFTLPLVSWNSTPIMAVGYALSRPGARPEDLILAAADAGWSAHEFENWLSRLPHCQPELLKRYLHMAVEQVQLADHKEASGREIHCLAGQLEHIYEEISLLHTLTQNMQISRAPGELAMLSLERMNAVIQAEGHLIWLDGKAGKSEFHVEGEIPLDEQSATRLVARFENHDWSRPLVKNHITGTLLGADFPGLRNFVLVPIADGNHRSGWMVSCNLLHGEEFGTVQASLLASIASILGTHGRNINLYLQHEELLLSFVHSLVSTLDAKDRYTRGHSERVALIARRLGAEMKLPEEDLRDIYLSGLLHDIGKIGVDDEILRKPGDLTKEEFEQIKKHPVIGYNILVGLKNLQSVIPGVRHHHEAFNGRGYPDGLAGDDIPMMARILAVADSYDAMGSDRPYRKGMPLERLEGILKNGSGTQWDPRVVAAYFASRESIQQICADYTLKQGKLLAQADDLGHAALNPDDESLNPQAVRQVLSQLASMVPPTK